MILRAIRKSRLLLEHFLAPAEYFRRKEINRVCIGYSQVGHWLCFRTFLRHFKPRKVAMLGVYFGRDIAYLKSLSKDLEIVGVDRFADVPGEDWPAESSNLDWETAGFGPAPKLESAMRNLKTLGCADGVHLVQGQALDFLLNTKEKFDWIYIDVSHDYQTTKDLLIAAQACLTPSGILGGDDFSNAGTWGVEKAVREIFSGKPIEVFLNSIWLLAPTGKKIRFSKLLR